MPRNGSGVYTWPAGSFNPAVNGQNATAADWNTDRPDLETAISKSICADGQTTITGNIPFATFRITGLGDPVGAQDAATKNYVDATTAITFPSGCVVPFAGSSTPAGYLLCDGAAVSRTTYAALFAAIGTTYGTGDGSTTFNLPDITGRVVAGKEATATRLTAGVSGVDGATLGAHGGDQSLQSHGHSAGTPMQTVGPGNGALNAGGNFNVQALNTGTTGAGNSQNVQPTIILNYIIKT